MSSVGCFYEVLTPETQPGCAEFLRTGLILNVCQKRVGTGGTDALLHVSA